MAILTTMLLGTGPCSWVQAPGYQATGSWVPGYRLLATGLQATGSWLLGYRLLATGLQAPGYWVLGTWRRVLVDGSGRCGRPDRHQGMT